MEIEPTVTSNINFSDAVIREHGTGKISLIGTFDKFNVPKFPFQPPPFFITVCLSNFHGKLDKFNVAIRLEQKSSGYVVASAGGEIGSTTDLNPTDTIQVPFQLTGVFPAAGLYTVVVLAQSEQIASRDLTVNPVTAGSNPVS